MTGWRAHIDAHRGFHRDALHVIIGRTVQDQRWESIVALSDNPEFRIVDALEEPPGLLIPTEAARALYDALGQHYGGTADARQARADLERERARTDKLITALIDVTDTLSTKVAAILIHPTTPERIP